ncbi:MAG TPA: zinc ribbon domain-containing protein [bacterium]|nr:zinc ribbon domain-containing protein [bacterium]
MPIYVYEVEGGDCDKCGGQFEMLEPLSREPLSKCPLCKRPVHRIIAAAHVQLKVDYEKELTARGFKALSRDNSGELRDRRTRRDMSDLLEEAARQEGVSKPHLHTDDCDH